MAPTGCFAKPLDRSGRQVPTNLHCMLASLASVIDFWRAYTYTLVLGGRGRQFPCRPSRFSMLLQQSPNVREGSCSHCRLHDEQSLDEPSCFEMDTCPIDIEAILLVGAGAWPWHSIGGVAALAAHMGSRRSLGRWASTSNSNRQRKLRCSEQAQVVVHVPLVVQSVYSPRHGIGIVQHASV